MMSRITISLKSSVDEMRDINVVRPVLPSMFTQHSRMRVAQNVKVVINQNNTGNCLDFGVELPTMDLLRNQPNSDSAMLSESANTTLTPNRPTFFDTQQSSRYAEGATTPRLPEMIQQKSSAFNEVTILGPNRSRLSTIQQESSDWDLFPEAENLGFPNRARMSGSFLTEGPKAI